MPPPWENIETKGFCCLKGELFMKTAILVDGGFYRRHAYSVLGDLSPEDRAQELYDYCQKHLHYKGRSSELYRILYYDCLPSSKRVYHPFLKRQIDLAKNPTYK